MKNKRGFTLMEVVIAIAIIMISGATAMSIIVSSANANELEKKQYKANLAAQNAIECFRYSDSPEMFDSALSEIGFAEAPGRIEVMGYDFDIYEAMYYSVEKYTAEGCDYEIVIASMSVDSEKKAEVLVCNTHHSAFIELKYELATEATTAETAETTSPEETTAATEETNDDSLPPNQQGG